MDKESTVMWSRIASGLNETDLNIVLTAVEQLKEALGVEIPAKVASAWGDMFMSRMDAILMIMQAEWDSRGY